MKEHVLAPNTPNSLGPDSLPTVISVSTISTCPPATFLSITGPEKSSQMCEVGGTLRISPTCHKININCQS